MPKRILRFIDEHELGILSVVLAACLLLSTVIGLDLNRRRAFPDREYIIATDHSPPFQVVNPDGTVTGAMVEAIDRAAKRLGIRLRWRTVTGGPDDHLGVDPNIDLWPFVMDLPERKHRFHIAQGFVSATYLLVGTRSPVDAVSDQVAGWRMGHRDIPYFASLFRQSFPQSVAVPVKEVDELLAAACRGDIDAAVTEPNQLQDFLLRNRDRCGAGPLRMTGIPHWRVNLSIGSTPENAALADALRVELGILARDHALDDLFIRFQPLATLRDGNTFAQTEAELSQRTAWSSLVLLALLSAVLGLRVIWLRRRTADAIRLAHDRYRYLADMSHELRTPLNGILGMAHLLEDANLSTAHRDYLRVIEHSGMELLATINNVLDLAKLERQGPAAELEWVSPRELTEIHFRAFVPTLQARDIESVLLVDPEVPQQVRLDAAKLRQIFVNLVGNAVKFTERGFVHIRVGLVEFPSEDRHLRIEVIDSGPGMSETERASLFTAFTQAGAGIRSHLKGTGLGLEISKRLAFYSGGQLGVSSQPGSGSTFWFEIPCELALPSADGAKSAEQPDRAIAALHGKRVVLVGAHPRLRASLAVDLARSGAGVVPLESLDAIERGVLTEADIVAVDATVLESEGRVGVEILRRFRRRSGAEVAVLCNGNRQASTLQQWNARWLRPVLKPVCAAALLSAPVEGWDRGAGLASLAKAVGSLPPAGSLAIDEPPAPGDAPLRILVGEDNPVNRMVIQAIIERLGHAGKVIPDGRRLLAELSRGETYDLVLMDCNMPELDGYEASQRIRQMYPDPEHLPIVAVTASSPKDVYERCIASGMNDVVAKPVTAETLREVLSRFARGKRAR